MTRKNLTAIAAIVLLTATVSVAGSTDVQPAGDYRINPLLDIDRDGMAGFADNCPFVFNPAQTDSDADGTGDMCDATPWSPGGSTDGQQPDCTIFGAGACDTTVPDQG